jgi:hypothetical protein
VFGNIRKDLSQINVTLPVQAGLVQEVRSSGTKATPKENGPAIEFFTQLLNDKAGTFLFGIYFPKSRRAAPVHPIIGVVERYYSESGGTQNAPAQYPGSASYKHVEF